MKAKAIRARRTNGKTPPAAPVSTGGAFRSRIVGEGFENPRRLRANPLNWRVHTKTQTGAVREALKAIGWIQRVIVNRRSGNIIDGHQRVEIAIEDHEPSVPVLYVDLPIEEERLALATLDPLTELAATDPEKLATLLGQVNERPEGALGDLLTELEGQAGGAILREVGTVAGRVKTSDTPASVLRMLLMIDDIALVERAIVRTGTHNRGEAFVMICRAYLNSTDEQAKPDATDDDSERQHGTSPQGELASEFAEALHESGNS
jgi:hypothetical protein